MTKTAVSAWDELESLKCTYALVGDGIGCGSSPCWSQSAARCDGQWLRATAGIGWALGLRFQMADPEPFNQPTP